MSHLKAQQSLEQMHAWASENSQNWPTSDEFGVLLRATFARATKTFAAAVMLTGKGYGPGAVMLARSLCEDMIVAYWMVWVPEPQYVVRRLADQARYLRLVAKDTMDSHKHLLGDLSLPDEDDLRSDQDRYTKLFGDVGQINWWAREITKSDNQTGYKVECKRTLHGLIKELEDAAERQADTGDSILAGGLLQPLVSDMRLMFDICQRSNNAILHHTATGVLRTDKASGHIVWDEGPSKDLIAVAQGTLYLAYEKLIYLMCDRFNPGLAIDYLKLNEEGFSPFVKSDVDASET
jgi:hypothetical protein